MRLFLLSSIVAMAPLCDGQMVRIPGPGGRATGGVATTARDFAGTSILSSTGTGYLSSAASFTFAFWFKSANITQSSTYVMEFGNNSGSPAIIYGYVNDGSGHAQLEFFSGSFRASSQITILDTNWHHVAWRYNGTEWAKYLDGTKTVINSSFSSTLPSGAIGIWVGATFGNLANFTGSLARLYISSAAISDAQITAMASATCSTSGVSGTLAYWLLGVGSPETESPPSGGSNSLTVPGSGTSIVTGPSCSSL